MFKGKTDFYKDRFEWKIEKQKQEAEASKTYAPRSTKYKLIIDLKL
jgi:hypothetical protein